MKELFDKATGNNYDADAEGDRTSIALIAPGDSIELNGFNDTHRITPGGTSYATPHVTGTVALLQQYANERIMDGGWDLISPRRHEVMKAVLMNSADKIKDDGTFCQIGCLLGMERTVLDRGPNGDGLNGRNWFQSEAYGDVPFTDPSFIALDDEMGAGHLNAKRARQQFAAGESNSDGAAVPLIGWDYGATSGENDFNKYVFNQPLLGGSFISATIAWDRVVNFAVDEGFQNVYDDPDDMFEPYSDFLPHADDVINDLDLYLVPAGMTVDDAIAASLSNDSTIDHLFFEIPSTGNYELWVHQWDDEATGGGQNYGIAWWAAGVPAAVPGDYDGNGSVGPEDYNLWRGDFGEAITAGTGADGNGNGVIDAADYVVWRKNLSAGSGNLASVPEPSGLMLFAVAGVLVAWKRSAQKRIASR